jgi:hypothetical protein
MSEDAWALIRLTSTDTPKPMKPKQSSRIGNLAMWVVMIVAMVLAVILANHFVPVIAGSP